MCRALKSGLEHTSLRAKRTWQATTKLSPHRLVDSLQPNQGQLRATAAAEFLFVSSVHCSLPSASQDRITQQRLIELDRLRKMNERRILDEIKASSIIEAAPAAISWEPLTAEPPQGGADAKITLIEKDLKANKKLAKYFIYSLPPGHHNPCTHLPKDPECIYCIEAKMNLPHAKSKLGWTPDGHIVPVRFGDIITCDKLINDIKHKRAYDVSGYAIIAFDITTKYVYAYPSMSKSTAVALRDLNHFVGTNKTPKLL